MDILLFKEILLFILSTLLDMQVFGCQIPLMLVVFLLLLKRKLIYGRLYGAWSVRCIIKEFVVNAKTHSLYLAVDGLIAMIVVLRLQKLIRWNYIGTPVIPAKDHKILISISLKWWHFQVELFLTKIFHLLIMWVPVQNYWNVVRYFPQSKKTKMGYTKIQQEIHIRMVLTKIWSVLMLIIWPGFWFSLTPTKIHIT